MSKNKSPSERFDERVNMDYEVPILQEPTGEVVEETVVKTEEDLTASLRGVVGAVNGSGWASMPIASTDASWDGPAAKSALWSWADGDMGKYRKGFLYWDADAPDVRGSYKLPIARPEDGTLTIIPAAVNAVASVLGGGRGGVDIPASDKAKIGGIVRKIQNRFHENDGTTASLSGLIAAVPIKPPREWFQDPNLQGPTPLTVTADGRVYGHVGTFDQCHVGIKDRCQMVPRNTTGYRYFKQGSVETAEGDIIRVGVVTGRTNHADSRASMRAAIDHYANSGSTRAIGNVGEDQWGVWFAGAAVPGSTDEDLQELRRHPLSGHWAPVHGNLELVNALAVNHPGFPIYAVTASGELDGGFIASAVFDKPEQADITFVGTDVASERIDRLAKITAKLHEIRTKKLLGEK